MNSFATVTAGGGGTFSSGQPWMTLKINKRQTGNPVRFKDLRPHHSKEKVFCHLPSCLQSRERGSLPSAGASTKEGVLPYQSSQTGSLSRLVT